MSTHTTLVLIPYFLVLCPLLVIGFFLLAWYWKSVRGWWRTGRYRCPDCGYAREHLVATAPCPECGRDHKTYPD